MKKGIVKKLVMSAYNEKNLKMVLKFHYIIKQILQKSLFNGLFLVTVEIYTKFTLDYKIIPYTFIIQ